MVDTIHSGSVETAFQIALIAEDGTPLSLSGKTMTMFFQRPDETRFNHPGSAFGDPNNGVVEYIGIAAEFDMLGSWKRQAKVVDGTKVWYSDWIDFEVLPNLT